MKTLFVAAGLLLAASLYADGSVVNSVGSPCTSVGTNFTSVPIDLNGYRTVSFQVTSDSTSQAVVTLYKRNTPNDQFAPVFSVTNPTSSELGYDGPPVGQIYIDIAWTAGSLSCSVIRNK